MAEAAPVPTCSEDVPCESPGACRYLQRCMRERRIYGHSPTCMPAVPTPIIYAPAPLLELDPCFVKDPAAGDSGDRS